MKLSIEWLNEFVDINIDKIGAKNFSEAMSLSGSKVETYEYEAKNVKNIVVGEILETKKHPDADKLTVCKVKIADEEIIQIVTAATNISKEDKVPVALHNSTIADGTKIKKSKLRGVLSQGMFCSVHELGVTVDDFPGAADDGIFILPKETKIGANIKEALNLNDLIYEFEITSNRPDCFSIIGLAREVAATYNLPLKLHTPSLKNEVKNSKELNINVENKELCKMYCAKIVEDIKIEPSPEWLRARLRRMGVKPINNIVDITNYVMLEYGQPMHAFDLNLIENNTINVRNAKENEKITTLDEVERNLTTRDLIIADDKKPLAIAGVMGGQFSSINDNTKEIVFESANFAAQTVRNSSRHHNLRTASSSLFEKELDPNNCLKAMNRACELIEILNAGKVTEKTFICKNYDDKCKTVLFEHDWINKFLNIDLSRQEMESILKKLDFKIKGNEIIVPTYRLDIEGRADIAEEIARFYGYNNIKETELKNASFGGYSDLQKFKYKVKDTLISLGAYEIMTYSFVSPKVYDKMCISETSSLRDYIKISNPLGEDTSVMKTICLPSILQIVSKNINNKNSSACLFEIAKEYIKNSNSNLPNEINKIAVAIFGEEYDFFYAKGIAESLLKAININNYKVEADSSAQYFHPGRCAKFSLGDKTLGYVAQMHPTVLKNFDINKNTYVIYFDFDLLFSLYNDEITFKPLPKFPAVFRDLALVCDENMPVSKLEEIIKKSCPNILEELNIFDVYTGSQVESGKKSIAFKLKLRSQQATLTEEKIEKTINKILENMKSIEAKLR